MMPVVIPPATTMAQDGPLPKNGAIYYYVTNLQGDVVGILNSNGTTVGTYEYDPYGNIVSISGALAATNPLRYRGYYYDKETGFYYLQSRYYDPSIGRFINADSLTSTGQGITGNNMYAYCNNNPVNMSDSFGHWPEWLETSVKVLSVVAVAVAVVVTCTAVSALTAGTATPLAVAGATAFLGATLSGINGGVANESKGNSYINGYAGGVLGGCIQSLCSYYCGSVGTAVGGVAGVAVGTATTDLLNNVDPDSKDSSAGEIMSNATISGMKALGPSMLTGFVGYASDCAVANMAYGLMPAYSCGFGEAVKIFFGWLDDALVYRE